MPGGPRNTGWQRPLDKALLPTTSVRAICTLADARTFILHLDARYSRRQHWQRAIKLVMAAAEGGDLAAASLQMERALFLDAMLRLDAPPPKRRRNRPR